MKKLFEHLSLSVCCLGICVSLPPLQAADEPRYLIPEGYSEPAEQPSQTQNTPKRSTYESLTEPRGTFKTIQDHKDQVRKEQEELLKRAQAAQKEKDSKAAEKPSAQMEQNGPVINFSDVSITEVLKYVSKLTGKNFIYDPQELRFNVTMVSDSSSSLEELVAMVIQSLRAHGYSVLEEGSGFVVHTNPNVKSIGGMEEPEKGIQGPQIATRVFVLQNLSASNCAAVVRAMVSDGALVEAVGEAKIVVSDVTENLNQIASVLKQMDTSSSGLEIGQYVAINSSPATLQALTERILRPIAGDRPLVLIPHAASNSIFIVSTQYLIEKSLSIMQATDLNLAKSGLLDNLKFDKDTDEKARVRKALEESQKKGQEGTQRTITDDDIREYLREQGVYDTEITPEMMEMARKALRAARETEGTKAEPSQYRDFDFVPGVPGGAIRKTFAEGELPLGTVEATKFLIYRLQYRKSADVVQALRSIAESLLGGGRTGGYLPGTTLAMNPELAHSDLILTLNSLQAVDDNNTIVFTGTQASLLRAKELIQQIDIPVRQVFIEALILDTTIANSLNFGVEWTAKMERTNFAAGMGFIDPLETTGGFNDAFNNITYNPTQTPPFQPPSLTPPPQPGGLSAGFFGRKIKFLGKGFRSTGALVRALEADQETHIIMNPKIVTEHNVPAEVFVGEQTPIKGQTIANSTIGSTSSVLATNYQTQETGISLKVTPLISSNDTVTLIIEQKVSSVNQIQVNAQGLNNAPPATVKEERTVTRVHLPSDHFLVLSGLIREDSGVDASRIPCLGSLPIIGTLFGVKLTTYNKRNLMVFIRPVIIDTPNDIDEITKSQENIMKQKSTVQEQGWNRELDQLKCLLNIEPSIF